MWAAALRPAAVPAKHADRIGSRSFQDIMEGAPDSGFAEFREFLRNAVESGEAWRMKVDGARGTVRKIVNGLLEALRKEQMSIADDRAFYQALLGKIEGRREKAFALKLLVVDSLLNG